MSWGKNKLAPALAAALLDSRRMGQFFGTISDETAAEFEKAAAAGGMEYQGTWKRSVFCTTAVTAGLPAWAQQLFPRMWQRHTMN